MVIKAYISRPSQSSKYYHPLETRRRFFVGKINQEYRVPSLYPLLNLAPSFIAIKFQSQFGVYENILLNILLSSLIVK